MSKIKMTYNQYDLLEAKISKCGYENPWYPTSNDVKSIKEPIKYYKFLIYLANRNDLTEKQQMVKKEIQKLLYSIIELTD